MAMNLNDDFFAGFLNGEPVFSLGNPYMATSPAHMAFEAGRFVSRRFIRQHIKGARMSRGYSVRVFFTDGTSGVLAIDYDRKTVSPPLFTV